MSGSEAGLRRAARVERITGETRVLVELDLDGAGVSKVATGVPFFDHMLAQLAKHGRLDLTVQAEGDTEIDAHHTVEDTALTLGQALREALGDKAGICRFGDALIPLDETLAQINQMTEMVENLLTLARADEGRAPLAVEESDLREVVADVAETAGMLGEQAGVSAVHSMPETPVRLAVDRHRIREMLLNMVTNAIKYTPQGGTVALNLEQDDGGVTFTVRDSGIGIAPGDLPNIFDRFWRADQARSRTGERPGTGLGLAITKWIAEAHGGSITVQSRPGRGSTFVVRLPKTNSKSS